MCRKRKPLAQILLLDQGQSIKPKLDTGVEVYDNKVKKKQHHATNEKPNKYLNIFNKKRENTVFCDNISDLESIQLRVPNY